MFGGNSLKLLDAAQNNVFTFCLSEKLVDEVFDKLVNKFNVNKDLIEKVDSILSSGKMYTPNKKVNFPQDPKDVYLLELAEESETDFLITGDKKHLLPLKMWKSTKIISPKEAVNILF